jgi:hypothetical protein
MALWDLRRDGRLARASQAWLNRAQAVAAELRSSPDPDVRDVATILNAHLVLGQDRFDEAADAFEASIRRGGGTWAAETTVDMVGGCHLLAGRPQEALPGYARGVADALEKGAQVNIGFQGEGIAAALADLGRHDDTFETLGACDSLAGDGAHPRELNAAWNNDVMAPRIASARATLGTRKPPTPHTRGVARSASTKSPNCFCHTESRAVQHPKYDLSLTTAFVPPPAPSARAPWRRTVSSSILRQTIARRRERSHGRYGSGCPGCPTGVAVASWSRAEIVTAPHQDGAA